MMALRGFPEAEGVFGGGIGSDTKGDGGGEFGNGDNELCSLGKVKNQGLPF